MPNHRLRGIRYRGGKQQIARWVAAQLPPGQTYVEPCAGMASVLLARPRVAAEVLNDLDHRIVDWWQAVRDHPDELTRRLEATPYSLAVFDHATALLAAPRDQHPLIDRAWAAHVILTQSFAANLDSGDAWLRPDPYARVYGSFAHRNTLFVDRLKPIAARIADVHLDNTDALAVVDRYQRAPTAVIYIDPPYDDTASYRYQLDYHALADLVRDAPASIAISGYPTCPWTTLLPDWRIETTSRISRLAHTTETECLWTNYDPPGRLL